MALTVLGGTIPRWPWVWSGPSILLLCLLSFWYTPLLSLRKYTSPTWDMFLVLRSVEEPSKFVHCGLLDLSNGSADHPCKLPTSPPQCNLQRDCPWRPGTWQKSYTSWKTWCWIQTAQVGWWRWPSNSPLVGWGCCCIPIIHQTWWRSMILRVYQQGQKWGVGGRHSWLYGCWDTNSLNRVIISQLLSSWQRRMALPGRIWKRKFCQS